jgi:hypothetical protein
MRSPIEVDLVMGGSVMRAMQLVSPITILLLRASYAPSTLMLIWDPNCPKRSILRISYDYLPDMISEFHTSFSTKKLPAGEETTNGENTPD